MQDLRNTSVIYNVLKNVGKQKLFIQISLFKSIALN